MSAIAAIGYEAVLSPLKEAGKSILAFTLGVPFILALILSGLLLLFFLYAGWAFSGIILVGERHGAFSSLQASYRFIKKHFWDALLFALLMFVLVFFANIISNVVTMPFSISKDTSPAAAAGFLPLVLLGLILQMYVGLIARSCFVVYYTDRAALPSEPAAPSLPDASVHRPLRALKTLRKPPRQTWNRPGKILQHLDPKALSALEFNKDNFAKRGISMRKTIAGIAAVAAAVFLFTSCATEQQSQYTATGAGIGAVTGAVLGAVLGSFGGRAGEGAVIGSIFGGLAGASIGNNEYHLQRSEEVAARQYDYDAARARADLVRIEDAYADRKTVAPGDTVEPRFHVYRAHAVQAPCVGPRGPGSTKRRRGDNRQAGGNHTPGRRDVDKLHAPENP